MHVWQADLRRSERWIAGVVGGVLGEDEARRGDREAPDVWRRRVVARASLRIALGLHLDLPPDSFAFSLGPGGKPEIATPVAGGGTFFNISRAGDLCLIAIREGGPVGVDVEEIRDVPELADLVRSRFAPSEAAAILERSEEARLCAFYRCWTRKEAYLKAIGTGIGASVEGVVVSVGERAELLAAPGAGAAEWSLLDLALDGAFAGALAIRGPSTGYLRPLVPMSLPLGP